MVSSDDEAEFGPQSVSNYHFVDDDDGPTSFSVLPLHWSKSEDANEKKKEQIFVHGSVDNGLQTIHKEVTAWKFDLLNANPEISVLTKENSWIKLEKPRKSFEEIIRTVLITVQCLHFASRNPDASEKSIWDHLSKVFSFYEVRPSQNDLVDHMALISESVKQDQSLSKSKFLLTFLEKKPRKRKLSDEDVKATPMSGFIVDMDDGMLEDEDIEEDTSNEDDDLFDSVCALCDNGGELLCCDGICMRSFHATEEAARNSESNCKSLGLSRREVEANSFYCKNCEYKQHQCFACGELGSSDKSSGAEVFQCASATCGYFYHPHCIAKLLHQEGEAAEELEKNVAAGQDFFICPIHKCCVCKQGEDKKIEELQFAVCRRCPTSYHRKCLPREIGFEKKGEEDDEEDVETRAWEGLLPGRILIYCLKHEIIDDLGTPIRDVRFPDVEEKRKKQISELPGSSGKVLSKKRRLTSEDSFSEKTVKEHRESSFCMKKVANMKKSENISSGSNSSRKVKENDGLGKSFKGSTKSATTEVNRSEIANISLGDKLFALMTQRAEVKLGKHDMLTSEPDKTMTRKISSEKLSSELSLDAVTERRLLALMKEVASSITLEDVINKRKVPSTHSHSLKTVVEKTINAGKVVGAVEAVRTALNKLETGCSTEDAKAVCEPEVLNQLFRWKNKLAVYLAPFLRGKRYTSFGRHFTKIEKLEKIVDILHWYMQDGDMIVDFCCGANDFSCLMKKKLEEMGKKCSYKNYDLIQPKIDFNFEKRDWMTVRPDELPKRGSQLIMGLNPPFGVKASLANKFINQALKFKPKLLILIVPPETERLDKKNPPYDLVWEDDQCLSGKSFYLPGSVNESDKQMDQWNLISPPLYLWSRRDWSARHKAIAQKYGHVSRQQEGSSSKNCLHKTEIYDHPMEVHCYNGDASELTDDLHMQNKELNREICVAEGHGDSSPQDSGVRENQVGHDPEINQSKETLSMRKHGEDKLDRGINEKLPENTQNGRKSPGINTNKGVPHHTSPKVVDGRSSQEGRTSRSHEMHLPTEAVENRLLKSEPGISGSHYKRAYGSSLTSIHDDVGRSYSMSYDEKLHGIRGYSCANLEEQSSGTMRERGDVLSQVRHYGQDPDYSMQRNCTGGQYPGYGHTGSLSSISYGNLGAAAESSYRMNMSAMQRYAPRLDEFELNHARMNSYGPDPMNNYGPDPSMFNRNGMYNPQLPRPGYHVDSMGFAPGPHHPYSHHNSAGWLNE